MILNNPNCYNCDDYGLGAPTGIVPSGPGEIIMDKVKVSLTGGVAKAVLFTQISVLNKSKWTFSGLPRCTNSNQDMIGYLISNETGTGFTVTADEDSTFECTCVKL